LKQLDDQHLRQFASTLDDRARHAHGIVLEAHARRKRFLGWAGQYPVLPETALRRALRIGDAQQVGKKRVLCFGDDDMTSLALAALGHAVTVVDLDETLFTMLSGAARTHGLELTCQPYDARDPLPDLGVFDAFVTDPVSSRACFELFLSRALGWLAPNGTGYVAVHAFVTRTFSAVASELGIEITRWLRRHNSYYGPSVTLDRYESDWVEIKKTPATRLAVAKGEFARTDSLFMDDVRHRPPSRLYYLGDLETRFAKPSHLSLLFEQLQARSGCRVEVAGMVMAQEWTVVRARAQGVDITLHVDRARKEARVALSPAHDRVEQSLLTLLIASFKSSECKVNLRQGRWVTEVSIA
jgi:hypothetical protein